MTKPKLAIAGASGFIGKAAIDRLADEFNIKALSRVAPSNKNSYKENVHWHSCDLYNLKEAENAFKDCDYILYLIHSMKKGNRLTQSSFDDLDLIIADNVMRSAKINKVKQIIYVGGILPEVNLNISKHLKSRNEVEVVLSCSGIPLTTVRAAIIIGAESSSFQILYRLIKRLRVMITPKWTRSLSQPIDVQDITEFIYHCIGNEETFNKTIDVHGSELLSYNELMTKISNILKLKRIALTVPFFSLGLSKFWLHLITGIDYFTISPLVDSLKYNLIASNSVLFNKYIPNPVSLNDSLQRAISQAKKYEKVKEKSIIYEESKVRTVQRLYLPIGWDAIKLGREYINWLPKIFFTIIRSKVKNNVVRFSFFSINLLTLEFSQERSTKDRQLFYIKGGLLVIKKTFPHARFEFRISPHEQTAIAAIHDYYPSLPWPIYRIFQANIHKFVMYLFNRHLLKNSSKFKS
ncbi:NAD(P)H-binding protein [Pigmentibacter ruber]|uniref:NAD(P)H-binding protein n=1 Tax=Pigmentibacter ruber TaxID=2683196 RepID=UPI00131E2D36|nr:NAD(P)H-binding protein [Pigmentibacter ruber]